MPAPPVVLGLSRRLTSRLLPAALLIGTVISLGFAVVVYLLEAAALAETARTHGRELARQVERLILDEPGLWKYQSEKYVQLVETFLLDKDIVSIRIRDAEARPIGALEYVGPGATGWRGRLATVESTPVRFNNRVHGHIEIGVSASRVIHPTLVVFAVSAALGLGLATFVYVFPVSIARRLEAQLDESLATRARLYEESQAQRARLTQIFDSTSDGIMLLDPAGAVLAANRRAGELLDFDPDRALGRDLGALVETRRDGDADGEAANGPFRALLADIGRAAHGDITLPSRGRAVLWSAQPTRDVAGSTVGTTLTFRDVTREREIDQVKSDFVSFATHQLRTPLSGIKWMLELAGQEPGVPPDVASYVADAAGSAERLITMINALLDISQLESGRIRTVAERTDLAELTRSVLHDMKSLIADRDLQLSVTGAEGPFPALVDPRLFREVLFHLISNAVKYTPAGGRVTIHMHEADSAVLLEVRDTGIGIPKAARDRIFERFYRADNVHAVDTEGTGLGLHLVRLIVEHSGGRVWCESEEGRGSAFFVSVPRGR